MWGRSRKKEAVGAHPPPVATAAAANAQSFDAAASTRSPGIAHAAAMPKSEPRGSTVRACDLSPMSRVVCSFCPQHQF